MNEKQRSLAIAAAIAIAGIGVMPFQRESGIALTAGGVFLALRTLFPPRG